MDTPLLLLSQHRNELRLQGVIKRQSRAIRFTLSICVWEPGRETSENIRPGVLQEQCDKVDDPLSGPRTGFKLSTTARPLQMCPAPPGAILLVRRGAAHLKRILLKDFEFYSR